ncbi:hypothetical protein [Priestia abyssalis]|nr:hypothetical protein [Priestia abyssalis]
MGILGVIAAFFILYELIDLNETVKALYRSIWKIRHDQRAVMSNFLDLCG